MDSLKNSFIIAIVEIIKKSGYSKAAGDNIVVVPDEDDIIIRYLLVLKSAAYPSSAIISHDVPFEKHYNDQLKRINEELAQQRKARIDQAYTKFKERKERQKEQQKKIE